MKGDDAFFTALKKKSVATKWELMIDCRVTYLITFNCN